MWEMSRKTDYLPEMAQATNLNTIFTKEKNFRARECGLGRPVMGGDPEDFGKPGYSCYTDLSGTFSTDKFLEIFVILFFQHGQGDTLANRIESADKKTQTYTVN